MNTQPRIPIGDVTFVFTDIEGSTALWDRDPDAMTAALAEHDRRIRKILDEHRGYVFTTAGDSFAVAFEAAADAVAAALEIQLALVEPVAGLSLAVRIGVHSGAASSRDGDYFGTTVNRAARISGCAHGRQLVMSQTTVDLLGGWLPLDAELLDLGIHRLRGLSDSERIHQLCHPALDRDFPRLRTAEGPGDSLPTQLTSFVGREREVDEVMNLLRAHRLVTLTGSGGAGKTRLALRVAEELLGDFPDGLRVAELGAISDAEVLVEEIAQRFAVARVPGVALIRSITESLGSKRILLLLDNCEQIVSAAAPLCHDLLTSCPELHVLATSRERLGVAGESLFRVPSLSLPVAGATVEESLRHDAVRLFVERAQLVSSDFELTDDNLAPVVDICRRLDGIPLAIELAAARTRSMSPVQIVDRLGERFRLLTASDRTAVSRQRTLLGAIEWSHDLLDDDERRLFHRLGVFAADFSLASAEAVCAGDGVDEFDVADLVEALVDKSMVSTEPGRDGTTRYVLLETLREFARNQLGRVGEADRLAQRHADHFVVLAEQLQAQQRLGDVGGALLGLDQDEAEFRSALQYALDGDHMVRAGRLVGGLGYLWYAAGLHREGLQWCDDLFARRPELPDDVRAGALHSYGSLLAVMGRTPEGVEVLTEQVAIRRQLGDPLRLAAALNNLGNLLNDIGEYDAAEEPLAEAIESYRAAGQSASLTWSSLGWGRMHRGQFEDAECDYREALAEARRADHPYSIATAMVGRGQCLVVSGAHEAGRTQLVEARERFEELTVTPGIVDADIFLGVAERGLGNRRGAATHFLLALTEVGIHWYADADHWTIQLAASVIDDAPTSAVLAGAARAAYDRSDVGQSVFIREDLDRLVARLEQQLGPDEFGRHYRTGERRSHLEAVDIARVALRTFLDGEGTAP
jgi:predicted ATPase/class 3 adenylate cyclase